MSDTEFVSLMDLATFDTDEIGTLLSRNLPDGLYTMAITDFEGSETEPKDDKPPLVQFKYEYTVESAQLVKKGEYDPVTLVGRKVPHTITFWPKDLQQVIGLLKGSYQKVGLPNTGPIGGAVAMGGQPGWADNAVGARIIVKVQSFMSNGQERTFYEWVKAAPAA